MELILYYMETSKSKGSFVELSRIILHMAIIEFKSSHYVVSYGLFLKCKSICREDREMTNSDDCPCEIENMKEDQEMTNSDDRPYGIENIKIVETYISKILETKKLSDKMMDVIHHCIHFDLFQLLWILDDLEIIPEDKIDFREFKFL